MSVYIIGYLELYVRFSLISGYERILNRYQKGEFSVRTNIGTLVLYVCGKSLMLASQRRIPTRDRREIRVTPWIKVK